MSRSVSGRSRVFQPVSTTPAGARGGTLHAGGPRQFTESFGKANGDGWGPDLQWTQVFGTSPGPATSGGKGIVAYDPLYNGGTTCAIAEVEAATDNVYVEVEVIDLGDTTDAGLGLYLLAGYDIVNPSYREDGILLSAGSLPGDSQLILNNHGSYAALVYSTGVALTPGVWRLEYSDSQATAYLDGTQIATHSAGTNLATLGRQAMVLLSASNGFTTSPTIDNFKFGDLV